MTFLHALMDLPAPYFLLSFLLGFIVIYLIHDALRDRRECKEFLRMLREAEEYRRFLRRIRRDSLNYPQAQLGRIKRYQDE